MSQTHMPSVSVLICTRGRGDSILSALQSILTPESICCELLVIDQSSDDSTQQAVEALPADPRLRYVRSRTIGKGNALNEGLQLARGEFVAITDDDCEVPDTWPRYLIDAMIQHPQVTIAYGNVIAVDHDSSQGFIPEYFVREDRLYTRVWDKARARGIGANMAIRREPIMKLGGFDPELGPGGKFRASVDRDLTLRAFLAGQHVYECADSAVDHFGFRSWSQGRSLAHNAFLGIGATYIKPLRCGRWEPLPLLVWEFTAHAFLPFLWAIVTFAPHKGWQRVSGCLEGIVGGLRTDIDREHMIYRDKAYAMSVAMNPQGLDGAIPRKLPDNDEALAYKAE